MAKKKTPNQLYWKRQVEGQVRGEYEQWLREAGEENSPHNAHRFAMEVIPSGSDYRGMKERELIIFLAGAVPEMYD